MSGDPSFDRFNQVCDTLEAQAARWIPRLIPIFFTAVGAVVVALVALAVAAVRMALGA